MLIQEDFVVEAQNGERQQRQRPQQRSSLEEPHHHHHQASSSSCKFDSVALCSLATSSWSETARNTFTIINWPLLHRLGQRFLFKLKQVLIYGEHGSDALFVTNDQRLFRYTVPLTHYSTTSCLLSKSTSNTHPHQVSEIANDKQPEQEDLFEEIDRVNSGILEELTELRHIPIVDLVAGANHVMALTTDGDIYSWGDNRFGQLGTRNTFESLKPMLVGNHIKALACGANHTLALTTTKQVYAWGRNNYGQIGIGTNLDQLIPVKIVALESYYIQRVCCGGVHSMALTEDGQLFAFGGNSFGQLGIGNCTHQTTPTLVKLAGVKSTIRVSSMACGEYHSLILMSNGEIYSCGRNDQSQLGCLSVPNSEGSCLPVKISSTDRFISVASHFATNFSMAINTTGYCYVWGECTATTHHADQQQVPVIREPRKTPLISVQDTFAIYCRRRVTPFMMDLDQEERLRMRMMGSRLVERLRQSFNDRKSADVEFVVDGKSIFVHRWYLQLSSDYLNRMLSDEWIEQHMQHIQPDKPLRQEESNATKKLRIELRTYSYEVFYAYLRYLYTDILELDSPGQHTDSQNNYLNWMEMLDLAQCYLDEDLKQKCVKMMRHNLSLNNCCHYYQLAIRYQLKQFEKEIIIFVYNNILQVCKSQGFKSMSGDLCKAMMVAVAEWE